MKTRFRTLFMLAALSLVWATLSLMLALVLAAPARAHVVLSQPRFAPGARYAAFFIVEHGCGDSPTTMLRVDIPTSVTVLRTPEKPGWRMRVDRVKGKDGARIAAVTWRGHLDAKTKDQFGLFLQLPPQAGRIFFPTYQSCETGEARWIEIPTLTQSPRDLSRPAPMLELAADAADRLAIENPWSRATPKGATTAVAYLTIVNRGPAADTLLGASSGAASALELHRMAMQNGVMTMRPLDGLEIPAGASVKITPEGGYHLMLTGLKAALGEGGHFTVVLHFAKAGAVPVDVPIGAIGAAGPPAAMPNMPGMPGMK